MLTLGQPLIGKNILSLRIGRPIGIVGDPIINPNNLKIEGWYALESDTKQGAVLLSIDIRDILPQGFVVNDHDSLSNPDELIRLKELMSHDFTVIGKTVVNEGRKRLGKVTDYTFEKNGFFIQKLYVSQSIIKSFTGGALMVDRSQIIEITNKKIVIREATVSETAPMPAVA